MTLSDIDLWVTDLGFRHNTSPQFDTHLCQVISKSIHKWQSYRLEKLFYQICSRNMTLTSDLATNLAKNCLLHTVSWWWTFVSSYIKFRQLMKKLWTGQAVLSQMTFSCDLDLGPSHTVLAHCTLSQSHNSDKIHWTGKWWWYA